MKDYENLDVVYFGGGCGKDGKDGSDGKEGDDGQNYTTYGGEELLGGQLEL